MKKSSKILLIGYIAAILIIFIGYKLFIFSSTYFKAKQRMPAITVTAIKVTYADWLPQILASASLRAIYGVNVTTEIAGMVQTIYFTPGATVKKGDILVQLNADNDIDLLHSLEANAALAKITYNRDQQQYAAKAISKQVVDNDAANLKSLEAQVKQQADIVAKKTIRAPFSGRLGINQINLGQYLNPADKIVMLETTDPIYADFYVPQQTLSQLHVGQKVNVTTDAFPKKIFMGKLTTINPGVDVTTRNVEVEATLDNKNNELAPGMFANVNVILGKPLAFLTLPINSISFNPYGDIVYLVKKSAVDNKETPRLIVEQAFVTTGEKRDNEIQILTGISAGDTVVTSGQLKLRNGSEVIIENSAKKSTANG